MGELDMGKTTLYIDDDLMEEASRLSRLKTKRRVVEEGLRELIRKYRMRELKEALGTVDLELGYEGLMRQRNEQ